MYLCHFIVLFCLLCLSGNGIQKFFSDITCLMNLWLKHAQKLIYSSVMVFMLLSLSKASYMGNQGISLQLLHRKRRWVFWRITISAILLTRRCMSCMPFPMEGCGCSVKAYYSSPPHVENCSHYHYNSPEKSWLASVSIHCFYSQNSALSSFAFLIPYPTPCVLLVTDRLFFQISLFPLWMLQCSRLGFLLVLWSNNTENLLLHW